MFYPILCCKWSVNQNYQIPVNRNVKVRSKFLGVQIVLWSLWKSACGLCRHIVSSIVTYWVFINSYMTKGVSEEILESFKKTKDSFEIEIMWSLHYNSVMFTLNNLSMSFNPSLFIKNKQLFISSEGFSVLEKNNAVICSQRAMLPI